MSVRDLYPSKSGFLKTDDLRGQAHKLTIEGARIHNFDAGPKIVLAFVGKDKELPLNKTNSRIIAATLGDDEKKWAGSEIELFPGKTSFQGKIVDCVNVRVLESKKDKADEYNDVPF